MTGSFKNNTVIHKRASSALLRKKRSGW